MSPPGLARAGALTFAYVVFGSVLAFGATLVVTNGSGPAAAGAFFQVVAVFAVATTLSTFGADVGLVRTVSGLRARNRSSSVPAALRIAAGPALVLASVVAITAVTLGHLSDLMPLSAAARDAVALTAPFLVLGVAMNVAFGALRGLHRVPTFSFLQNVVLPSLRFGGVALAVVMGGSVVALAAAWAAPVAVVMVLAMVVLRRALAASAIHRKPTKATDPAVSLRGFWSFSSARGVTAVIESLLEWIDVLLVAWLIGPAEAGVYGVVNRCIRMGVMLDHTARIVTGPSLSAALAVDDLVTARQVFTRATAVLMAGSWPYYLTLIVFGPAVLSFFGESFDAGYPPMVVIASAMLLSVSAGGVQSVLLMAGRSRWQLLNKLSALIVAIILNLWLIPHWGLIGAATAWAAAVLTDTGLALFQTVRLLGIKPDWTAVARIALAAFVLTGGVGVLIRILLGTQLSALAVHLAVMAGAALLAAAAVFRMRRRTDSSSRATSTASTPIVAAEEPR